MSKVLSATMEQWLAHVRAASDQGVSIKAYAVSQGVSAAALYQAKSVLMDCGAWPRSSPRKSAIKASAFVPVRVESVSRACRLSHVSGWSIECEALPPTQWLNELLRGSHAEA